MKIYIPFFFGLVVGMFAFGIGIGILIGYHNGKSDALDGKFHYVTNTVITIERK